MNKINELLLTYQDKNFKNFNNKIINTNYPMIGVKTPYLKKIAKDNIRNYKEYFKLPHSYYEEYMIHGFMLGYLNLPFDELIKYIDEYIDMINCWSMVDSIVSNLKIFKKNVDNVFVIAKEYIKSKKEFRVRFGYCILLVYFINYKNEKYIDEIIELCNKPQEKYYVQMMIAWLLSVFYIKFKEKGISFIKDNKLDNFTHNKTISKICDSYRVTKEEKELLKSLRRAL